MPIKFHSARCPRLGMAAAVSLLMLLPTASAAAGDNANEKESPGSIVGTFEGKAFLLSEGWGDAKACASDGQTARCYRTEAEMRASEGNANARLLLTDCATPVTLYSATSYGGSVLDLYTRSMYLALSSYGFSNITSSYKIGACAAQFYDVYPSTTLYPGSTAAGVWSPSMSAGWDNRVSSVRIS